TSALRAGRVGLPLRGQRACLRGASEFAPLARVVSLRLR
ncbi:unnamed protein product, partial [Amoebophrya sp. A25]